MLKIQPIRRSSRISVKRYIRQKQSGFTLIEALVAIVLLSIIVIGIITVAISAYKLEHFVDARQTAVNYAEWEMEYIKTQPYATSNQYTPAPNSPYPSNYTVKQPIEVIEMVTGKEQKISITITGNGVTYSITDYKVNY